MSGNRVIKAAGITADLARYFREHTGVEVFLKDLLEEFPKYTAVQIQSNVNNLNRTNTEISVDTLLRGQSWIYRPNGKKAAPTNRVFEQIAVTKTGALIIQDDAGTLYKATELE